MTRSPPLAPLAAPPIESTLGGMGLTRDGLTEHRDASNMPGEREFPLGE
jgi:hypothetical protein